MWGQKMRTQLDAWKLDEQTQQKYDQKVVGLMDAVYHAENEVSRVHAEAVAKVHAWRDEQMRRFHDCKTEVRIMVFVQFTTHRK